MNPAKPLRHVRVEPGDKWNSRGAAKPSGTDSGDRQTQQKSEWRDDPANAHSSGHVTGSLDDALKHADLILADSHEQRQGRADVECAGENPAPGNRSRKSLSRIFNFVAHNGCEFQANEAEAD